MARSRLEDGRPEPHRRQLLLWAGSLHSPQPTALSALVVHGLHDSPKAMTNLAEVVAHHSVNTFVSRMRGHFETDRSVLKRTVQWEEWLADAVKRIWPWPKNWAAKSS